MATLFYPSNIGKENDISPGWIQFSLYERKAPTNSVPSDTVCLYLPERLHNPNTVSWGNEDLGYSRQLYDSTKNAVFGNEKGGKGFWATAGGFIQRVGSTTGSRMAASALGAVTGENISKEAVLGYSTGKLANPYLSAIFKGVDFRTFDMTFKLAPFSEKDCWTIRDIIKTFRGASLPTGASNSAYLGYPKEFEVKYIWKGEENPFLHKFKRCVLTSVESDFTPQSQYTLMRNGFPAQIDLSLRFTEIEIIVRDDVEKDNY